MPMPEPMPMPMPEPMPMPQPMPMLGPMPMPMPMPMPQPQQPFSNLGPFQPLGALCKWVPTGFPFGSFSLPPWCRSFMNGNGFLPMVQNSIAQEPRQDQVSFVQSPGFGPFPFPTNWCQDYWSKSKCERNKKKGHCKGRGKRSRKTQNQCLKTCQFC